MLKVTNVELKLAHFENTKIVRHIKVKSIANPYDSEWQDYFKERQERRQKRKKILSSPKKRGRLDNRVNNKTEVLQDT